MIKKSFFNYKIKQYPFNLIIAITAILGGYCLLLFMDYGLNHEHFTVCPFKLVTTIPCPGCGMGRATLALFAGDIRNSLFYNILCIPFTAGVIIFLIWLMSDLIKGRNSFFTFMKKPVNNILKFIIFGLIFTTWILNILHGI